MLLILYSMIGQENMEIMLIIVLYFTLSPVMNSEF